MLRIVPNMRSPTALALLLPLLAACGSGPGSDSGGLSVVTSFYPLQYVTQRVVGNQVDVESLTAPGTEPHDAELTVARTAEVIDADVVVYLSGFQPAVDEAVEQAEGAELVDAADSADLVPLEGEHDHDHGEDETLDPHFWVDPHRLAAVVGAVADGLTAADPDNAERYAANAAELEDELSALDEEITEGLADCQRRTVVVSHDAFGYWGERYGLDMHAIAGLSPGSEPSIEHVAELQELIRSEGITTVFSETLASPKMAETLSSDLGLQTAVLDPVEGLSDETADEDYLSLMRQNLAAVQEANGCR
jgi:zinc transport system substrate-binding protein